MKKRVDLCGGNVSLRDVCGNVRPYQHDLPFAPMPEVMCLALLEAAALTSPRMYFAEIMSIASCRSKPFSAEAYAHNNIPRASRACSLLAARQHHHQNSAWLSIVS